MTMKIITLICTLAGLVLIGYTEGIAEVFGVTLLVGGLMYRLA